MNKQLVVLAMLLATIIGSILFWTMHEDNAELNSTQIKSKIQETTSAPEQFMESVPFWYDYAERELFELYNKECYDKKLRYFDVWNWDNTLRDENTPEVVIEAAKLCKKMFDRWEYLYDENNKKDRHNKAKETLENLK